MYYNGLGVEKDWERAKELYSKAAPNNKQAHLLLEELQDEMVKKTKNLKGRKILKHLMSCHDVSRWHKNSKYAIFISTSLTFGREISAARSTSHL